MIDWIKDHPAIIWMLVGASLGIFVGSLLLMPALITRIPVDYFTHARRPPSLLEGQPSALRIILRIGKNVLGCVFLLAGIAMLALPGQGLLTVLVGIALLDIPGKYRIEKWLVRRDWVRRPINWLRTRRNCEPLHLGSHQD
jgi:hypothetical protein